MLRSTHLLALCALCATVAACGRANGKRDDTANARPAPAPATEGSASSATRAATPRGGGVPLKVSATLSGGPGAGTFSATGNGECTYAEHASIYDVPAKQWAARYAGEGIESLTLTVWQFSGGTPDQFNLAMDAGSRSHRIQTVKGGEIVGSGKATHFEVDGQDADGTRVRASIDCERVTEAVAEGG
jgi:hypothetical protein